MTRSLTTMLKLACSLVLTLSLFNEAGAASVPNVSVLGTISDHLRSPGKLALGADGSLYVADTQSRGIVQFDVNARYVTTIPVTGVVRSVAVASGKRLVVSHNATVSIYDAAGKESATLSGFDFKLPNGIAIDAQERIYVADSKANRIAVFDPSGKFLFSFGQGGSGQGELNFPTGLAYEKVSDQLVVADTLNNRVQFFDLSGSFKRLVGSPNTLSGQLYFTYPQGISFEYTNGVRMYVADAFQSSVQVIDVTSQPSFVAFIGNYGSGQGQLQLPSDVVFDARHSDLLVSDTSGKVTYYGVDNPSVADATPAGVTPMVATNIPSAGSTGASASGAGTALTGGSVGSAVVAGGSTGATTSKGTTVDGSPVVWQYPTGIACSHAKAGSLVCRDK